MRSALGETLHTGLQTGPGLNNFRLKAMKSYGIGSIQTFEDRQRDGWTDKQTRQIQRTKALVQKAYLQAEVLAMKI